MKICY